MYAKVYGSIRVFKDEKAIVGTHIKKVEKFDEITNHLLQVFVAHNIRTKGVLTVSQILLFLISILILLQVKDFQSDQIMNAVSGNTASRQGGATSSMNVGASANIKDTIFSVMKEVSKSNKFMHKQDIWTYVQKQTDY